MNCPKCNWEQRELIKRKIDRLIRLDKGGVNAKLAEFTPEQRERYREILAERPRHFRGRREYQVEAVEEVLLESLEELGHNPIPGSEP